VNRAAEYVANWPDLSRKYAACRASPERLGDAAARDEKRAGGRAGGGAGGGSSSGGAGGGSSSGASGRSAAYSKPRYA
jgi:hypothetical protein